MAQTGSSARRRTTARLRLPGSLPDGTPPPSQQLDQEAWDHLQRIYGADAAARRRARRSRQSAPRASASTPSLPIVGAQIVEAARNEMALTLEDIVLRRTGLGAAGYPGDEAVLKVERLMRERARMDLVARAGRDSGAQGVLPSGPRLIRRCPSHPRCPGWRAHIERRPKL